jgi:hypothetical protein
VTYCHTCQLPTEHRDDTLCGRDRQRIATALGVLYRFDPAQLDPTRRARGYSAAPVNAPFASKPPLDLEPLALTLAPNGALDDRPLTYELAHPRADPDTPRVCVREEPLVVTVGRWADRAREDELLPPLRGGRSVHGEALRLSGILDALVRRWWAADMLRELAVAAERVDRALGRDEDRRRALPVGVCPAHYSDGTHTARHCGGRVTATPRLARCSHCGRAWHGEQALRELGRLMGGAYLDLAALARWTDETVPLLRQWAHRDGWRRQVHGRRKLYSLADAQTSWLRRRQDVGVVLVDETSDTPVASSSDATVVA